VAAFQVSTYGRFWAFTEGVTRGLAAVKNTKVLRDQEGPSSRASKSFFFEWLRRVPSDTSVGSNAAFEQF
jgi:hypothetical protein